MDNSTSKPDGRTLADFGQLELAERELLAACRKGDFGRFLLQLPRPEGPTPENTVRASFLRFLALGGDEDTPVHEKGVWLMGAWVVGELDLEGAILPHTLALVNCHFNITPVLRDSVVHGFLSFQGSHVEGLAADRMVCSGCVFLKKGFIATGKVTLIGAQIGGDLECHGGKFDGNGGDALMCERAVIKGAVLLRDGFTATGTVSFYGANIDGNLECEAGKFENKNGNALICERAVIKGNVLLRKGFSANGTVRLNGVKIEGNLECDGGKFDVHDMKGGDALRCDGAEIKGSFFLRNSSIIGTVWLTGVQIGVDLDCTGAIIDNRAGVSLACEQSVIKGKVLLNGNFIAYGTVLLNGTQIGGNLSCTGATLVGTNGEALIAQNMMVAGMFFFRDLVSVKGIVSLVAAKVGTLVDDVKSWPTELKLDGFVYDKLAVSAPTDAKSRLAWLKKQSASHIGRANNGRDFNPQPWRQLQTVLYDMGHMEDVRLVAIAFQDQRLDANLIGQTPKNLGKTIACIYRKICRGLHRLYRVLFRYGYYTPSRLIAQMLIVWLACGIFYSYAAYEGVFAPSNPLVFQNPEYDACKSEILKSECTPTKNWYLCEKLPEEYTGFSPVLYSLDLILPLVDLQQEHDWSPMIPTPKNTWLDELKSWEFPKHCTRFLMWFEILFGWIYSLCLVAVVSGLTKRWEE